MSGNLSPEQQKAYNEKIDETKKMYTSEMLFFTQQMAKHEDQIKYFRKWGTDHEAFKRLVDIMISHCLDQLKKDHENYVNCQVMMQNAIDTEKQLNPVVT